MHRPDEDGELKLIEFPGRLVNPMLTGAGPGRVGPKYREGAGALRTRGLR
jgi:hypothetical protein